MNSFLLTFFLHVNEISQKMYLNYIKYESYLYKPFINHGHEKRRVIFKKKCICVFHPDRDG